MKTLEMNPTFSRSLIACCLRLTSNKDLSAANIFSKCYVQNQLIYMNMSNKITYRYGVGHPSQVNDINMPYFDSFVQVRKIILMAQQFVTVLNCV